MLWATRLLFSLNLGPCPFGVGAKEKIGQNCTMFSLVSFELNRKFLELGDRQVYHLVEIYIFISQSRYSWSNVK